MGPEGALPSGPMAFRQKRQDIGFIALPIARLAFLCPDCSNYRLIHVRTHVQRWQYSKDAAAT